MPKKRSKQPLWLRALKEPAAATFIKKHSKEFPSRSFLPDDTEFGVKRKHSNEQIATLIAAQMPYADKNLQRLAELYLAMPPRDMAGKLGWSRAKVYRRIRALKKHARERNQREKTTLLNGRGKDALLSESAAESALRTLTFTLAERERTAYLINMGAGLQFWTDAAGVKFPQAVQDILFDIDELKGDFEVLHAE